MVTYRKIALTDAKEFQHFARKYAKGDSTMKNYRALTTVNRKDIHYIHKGDTVIIPDTILGDLQQYSIFRSIIQARTVPETYCNLESFAGVCLL